MKRIARGAAVLAASALAVTTLGAVPAGAAQPRPTDAGAAWLNQELGSDGLFHNSEFDFTDVGLSVDAALALVELGRMPRARRTADAVARELPGYIGTDGDAYAGAIAKSAVLARATGRDPRSFGGTDLVAALEQQVTPGPGPTTGRLTDTSEYGDYANTIGQGFAVRALTEAGSDQAGPATDFLLQQQCPGGFFRLYYPDIEAAEQGCQPGQQGSEPDTDVTSLAVINLMASGSTAPQVRQSVNRAANWLARQQRKNGALGGGTSTSAPNANSTGLAAWALGAAERPAKARQAAVWVRKQQPADVGPCRSELTKDRGAIGYNPKAVRDARKDGFIGSTEDQWRRTSAQALPGLRHAPTTKQALRVVAAPKQPAGVRVRVRIRGLERGQRACLWAPGGPKRIVGTGKAITRLVKPGPKASKKKRVLVRVRTLDGVAKQRVRTGR